MCSMAWKDFSFTGSSSLLSSSDTGSQEPFTSTTITSSVSCSLSATPSSKATKSANSSAAKTFYLGPDSWQAWFSVHSSAGCILPSTKPSLAKAVPNDITLHLCPNFWQHFHGKSNVNFVFPFLLHVKEQTLCKPCSVCDLHTFTLCFSRWNSPSVGESHCPCNVGLFSAVLDSADYF